MDLNDELLKNILLKNHQQYIGFIKTQENMLLVPIKTSVDRIIESQHQVVERFNTEVLTHNVDVLKNQQALASMFGGIARLMEDILQSQKSKEILKAQFISILETYIKSREAFTLMTSGREKEELVVSVREQIRLL